VALSRPLAGLRTGGRDVGGHAGPAPAEFPPRKDPPRRGAAVLRRPPACRVRRALLVSRGRRPVPLCPAHRCPDARRCRRGPGGEHLRYKVLPHRGRPEKRGGKRRLLSHHALDLDRLPDADDTVAAAQHPRDLDDGRGLRNAGGSRKLARLRQPVPAAGSPDLPVGPRRKQPARASVLRRALRGQHPWSSSASRR
jgi:hypothetical protein